MVRKRYTLEQIIAMLREAEVRLCQGEKTGAICRYDLEYFLRQLR